MSNTLSVIDLVGKEAQRIAHEKASFIDTVDRQYDDSFTYQANKGPNGQTLRVREPNQYTVRTSGQVMDVQDQNESTQSITVASLYGVDMRFNHQELMQSVNSGSAFDDLSKNYIEPAIAGLISKIEDAALTYCTKATYQVAGTAGTAITTLDPILKARAKLNQQLAPKSNRYAQVDSVTMAGLVNGVASYFNPVNQVSEQYREGLVSRAAGLDWYEQEKVWTLTNSNDITGTTDAAAQVTDGGTTVDMGDTITNAAVGSVFTIAGVYDCHPETKAAYAHLKQFVVTANSSGVCTVSPPTILTGAKKNVCSSTGADLATTDFNSKALTFIGAASTSYKQPLVYHKEAFQFVSADLPIVDDAHKCKVFRKEGLSLRVWQGSDIRNNELLMRIDALWGVAALRPAWATRLVGSANA